ncbi:UDP-N-acetylmuramate dehydrogenase [Candidatus Kaiserbacteria bacterium]|nr:UDP-N-acetylmuramate dehydrogenase [Candidatus Kaiserbacteria bacterium]
MQAEANVPLAPLTTFGLGGPARRLIRIKTVEALQESLDYARDHKLATLMLGGGSNMLVDDAGFDGLVIKIELMGVEREGDMLIAGAGESWDTLVERAVAEGLWGIENLSGIPGTVGAAPVQNIGAYGAELKDTLAWVEIFDSKQGTVARLANEECGFGYRSSRFKREGGVVVLRAAFRLNKNGAPNTTYKDLAGSESNTLAEIRQKVLAIRSQKFPDLSREGTAGSFFLNPVVSAEKAAQLAAQYGEMPQYAVEGGTKLSMAWLLDHALGVKGMAVGGARLYERQPLVIVASRTARSADVQELAEKIKALAKEKLYLEIEEEVRIIS